MDARLSQSLLKWSLVAACTIAAMHSLPALATSNCGSTTREAIAAAERAIATKGDEGATDALTCLIAAVKAMEQAQPIRQGVSGPLLQLPAYDKAGVHK